MLHFAELCAMSLSDAGLFVIDRRKVTGKHKLETPSGDPLRITPFGGGSEVGRSCILIEYKESVVMVWPLLLLDMTKPFPFFFSSAWLLFFIVRIMKSPI
jgi:hypothetical protein